MAVPLQLEEEATPKLLEASPGGDSFVFPEAEAEATIDREKAFQLAKESTLYFFKASAAAIRFFFEDCIQSFCQVVFLIKRWRDPTISQSSKLFTIFSICAGLMTSLAGPVKEIIAYRKTKATQQELSISELELQQALLEAEEKFEEVQLQKADQRAEAASAVKESLSSSPRPAGPANLGGPVLIPDVTLEEFFINAKGTFRKSFMAHIVLVFTNFAFWGTMVSIPIALDEKLHCKSDIPAAGHLAFFMISILAVLVEVWTILHSKRGYLLLRDNLPKFLLSVGFSFLGRFDTYSDITFYKILSDCEPITWFSIHEHVYQLPVALERISFWCLIVGVGCLQALPGTIMLMGKCGLSAALKFCEFNLVLQVMQDDAAGKEQETDAGH